MSGYVTPIIAVGEAATRALAEAGIACATESVIADARGDLLVVAVDVADERALPIAEELLHRASLAGAAAVLAVRTRSVAMPALRARAQRLGAAIVVNATPDVGVADLCRALVEAIDVPGLIGYPPDALHALCGRRAIGVIHRWLSPPCVEAPVEAPPALAAALTHATVVQMLMRAGPDVTLYEINELASAVSRAFDGDELFFGSVISDVAATTVLLSLFD